MSFFLKQAIKELAADTSDLQDLLNQTAEDNKTYTISQVDDKISSLIEAAPAARDTLKEHSVALNKDADIAGTVANIATRQLQTPNTSRY